MARRGFRLGAALSFGASVVAAQAPAFEPPARGSHAFVGVEVLSMEEDASLPAQTVLVEGDRITAIGRELFLPAGTTLIDGRGSWLMPGLVDVHTHERALPDFPDDVAGNLAMYLANGVTTIVNMGDFTGAMLGVREAVRSGTLAGPEVYVGHFVRGASDGGTPETVVTDPASAQDLVRRARAQGYDFLKLYDGVPAAAFDAAVAEARAAGLAVTGHAVAAVGLPYGLRNGQVMAAHAASFLGAGGPGSLAAATELAVASSAFVTATLFVNDLIAQFGLDALAGADPFARVVAQDGVEYMDGGSVAAWARMLQFRSDIRAPVDRRPFNARLLEQIRAFDAAGVPILLGTDTIGIPGVVPGFAIHGELRLLREAGLSPWRALAAGTRTAGNFLERHLHAPLPVGRVAAGARADLLLLDADPREDAETLRRPLAVMAGGRLYPRDALAAALARLRARR
jgi:imidazolonepropionase-like amidohydrolase